MFNIDKIKGLLNDGANIEEIEQTKDELDHRMECFVEEHGKYNELLVSIEDRDHFYHWSEARNREYEQGRVKVCERIHDLERETYNKSCRIRSSIRSKSSNISAHSRRV